MVFFKNSINGRENHEFFQGLLLMTGTVQLGCIFDITERYPLIRAKMINFSAMQIRTIDKQ